MKTVILNGEALPDRRALHASLAGQLSFPAWYGGNLDALYDLLSAAPEPCALELWNAEALSAHLGGYYRRFLRVLEDLREEGALTLRILPADTSHAPDGAVSPAGSPGAAGDPPSSGKDGQAL